MRHVASWNDAGPEPVDLEAQYARCGSLARVAEHYGVGITVVRRWMAESLCETAKRGKHPPPEGHPWVHTNMPPNWTWLKPWLDSKQGSG